MDKEKLKEFKKCLNLEVKLTAKAVKEAIKKQDYQEARDMMLTKTTVLWVLEELEHIEQTGRSL